MNIKKKEARMLIIISFLWFGTIYGFALLAKVHGIEFQNSFLHVLLYTGELLIGVLFLNCIKMNQAALSQKKTGVLWLIILLIVGGVSFHLWPLEKRLPGGLMVEVDENGDDKYYEKEKIVLKEEFQWDTEHDIKLLKGQFGYEFQLDKKTGSNSKMYVSDSMPGTCVEIEEYPTCSARKANIIAYSQEKIRTTTGELYVDNKNKFFFDIYFCMVDGKRIAETFYFIPGIMVFNHDEFSVGEEYLVGVSVQDDKNKEAVLRYADKESILNSGGKEIRIKMN